MTLNMTTNKNFVLVMSDSTGFATGGVSSLLNVGESNDPAHPNRFPDVQFL